MNERMVESSPSCGDHLTEDPFSRVGPTCRVLLSDLDPNPFGIRLHADEDTLARLTESIRKVGVLHPVLVRPKNPGRYEVVFGGLRVAASRRAGREDIDARVIDLSDAEAQQIALTENLDRFDLTPIDVARMVHGLVATHGKAGAAALMDRSIRSVELAQARVSLPEAIADGIIRSGLKGRHATALLRLQRWPEIQAAVFTYVATNKVTVAVCEPAVSRLVRALDDQASKLEGILRKLRVHDIADVFDIPRPRSPASLVANHAGTLLRDLRRLRRSAPIQAPDPVLTERLQEVARLIQEIFVAKPVSHACE